MKKKLINAMVVMLMITTISTFATTTEALKNNSTSEETNRAAILIERLDQIKVLDKTMMTRSEKRETRKEVNSINKELKQLGGGVYLSVGAVIIIILLLILLL